MNISLTAYAREKIQKIHALSARYNGEEQLHADVLLKLMKEHAEELEELYRNKDEHLVAETGDLLILCLELLLEKEKDANKIMELCYRRYEDKLKGLIALKRKKDEG